MKLVKCGNDTYGIYKIIELTSDVTLNITSFKFNESPSACRDWTGLIYRNGEFDAALTESVKDHPKLQGLAEWRNYGETTMFSFKEKNLAEIHKVLCSILGPGSPLTSDSLPGQ